MTKRFAPATERNRDPLLDVLQAYLPNQGTVLEIAAGTGQHAAFFAPHLAPRYWLPTDVDEESLASIKSWAMEVHCETLLTPEQIDVLANVWPVEGRELPVPVTAIVNINMLHIAPWPCCDALFSGASRLLETSGVVVLYGPFKRRGEHTAYSNAAFDENLRARDPHWGVRDLEAVVAVAERHDFECQTVLQLPANNLAVVFNRLLTGLLAADATLL
ncbi:MAG: DUF938 domain-containing protein [Luminiphilus sp.]|jgi:hypothetical protein|nr:DUF938 domain-containing protein [Luminiphilus sp.]